MDLGNWVASRCLFVLRPQPKLHRPDPRRRCPKQNAIPPLGQNLALLSQVRVEIPALLVDRRFLRRPRYRRAAEPGQYQEKAPPSLGPTCHSTLSPEYLRPRRNAA